MVLTGDKAKRLSSVIYTTKTIHHHQIRGNNIPRLLGMILDRSLSFNAHIKHIKQLLLSSFHAVRDTAHTSWDW